MKSRYNQRFVSQPESANEPAMLDLIDRKILTILQEDGRITNAKLAQQVGLSPPAVLERVRRLESSGVIAGYVALLDRERAGFGLQTIVMVCLSHHQISSLQRVKERLTGMTEVLECHQLTGEVDFLLKVAVKDMNAYTNFVNNKLSGIPGIQNVKTSFVLETLKNNTALKLLPESGETAAEG
jgi:Lrp/AsnC family transcriptional regulator, leucine-responsive regulatory protein